MSALHYLQFEPFDNPMQLSKVGNWVITFLSPKDELKQIQLAITHVIPRQASAQLQPRRIIIHSTEHEQRWLIQAIECFDSTRNQEIILNAADETAQQMLRSILQEFHKYDVDVSLI
ncbi:hypothetical protein [Acinetobacter sp. YH12147]|uniref:hypothetical protein n=1 Tax=Acinetobacter sp. YH12147 TaxID=2601130 RepID=UPI0015D0E792|nr:hypothetical protein [Acinetobacter sp. YH12147]